jgi:hypothetical protein
MNLLNGLKSIYNNIRIVETPESVGARGYDLGEMIILNQESKYSVDKSLEEFAEKVHYCLNN